MEKLESFKFVFNFENFNFENFNLDLRFRLVDGDSLDEKIRIKKEFLVKFLVKFTLNRAKYVRSLNRVTTHRYLLGMWQVALTTPLTYSGHNKWHLLLS